MAKRPDLLQVVCSACSPRSHHDNAGGREKASAAAANPHRVASTRGHRGDREPRGLLSRPAQARGGRLTTASFEGRLRCRSIRAVTLTSCHCQPFKHPSTGTRVIPLECTKCLPQ
ncbi:hypothetical protein MRX96_018681 [Rhipicephalus microplus]